MSQLRGNSKSGLEGDQPGRSSRLHHVHRETADEGVAIVVHPPSEEDDDDFDHEDDLGGAVSGSGQPPGGSGRGPSGRPGGGGHDSDPPIENENPNVDQDGGQEVFVKVHGSEPRRRDTMDCPRIKRPQPHHRKRKNSTRNGGDGTYIPPYKKKFFRRQASVLPSKFLLGGNIRDPLNLASLSDARINAELNKVTPQSSPLPMQGEVPVFIPRNPHDPLGLTTGTPENPEDMITVFRKNNNKVRKHRHRKRPGRKRTESECSVGTELTEDDDVGEEQGDMQIGSSANDALAEAKPSTSNSIKIAPRKRSLSEPPVQVPETVSVGEISAQVSKKNGTKTSDRDCLKATEASSSSNRTAEPSVEEKLVTNSSSETAPVAGSNFSDVSRAALGSGHSDQGHGERVSSKPDSTQFVEKPSSSGSHYQPSSEYVPMGSGYSHSYSPFALDSADYEYYEDPQPYESPTFANYSYTPTHAMQPFSPPPLPEVPRFQRRMQVYSSSSRVQRPQQISLQRAVFQRPLARRRMKHKGDPIVSPVIPQPGSRRRAHHHHHHHKKPETGKTGTTSTTTTIEDSNNAIASSSKALTVAAKAPQESAPQESKNQTKYRPKDQVFQFGNYSQYYGYRSSDQTDPRLWLLKKHHFDGKDVLDIGCNAGHVTLSIARDFEPKRVHGIDIDYSLITMARKNIKHYMTRDPDDKNVTFPRSMPMIYGVMQPPPVAGDNSSKQFPYNVSFAHENYVLQSDSMLDSVIPEYDAIVCFSVTKWIHLNFGDDGIKRFFRRVYKHLRYGGIFVLEPQPWSSYTKKKKLTEKIHQTFKKIKFYPDAFEEYLLSKEVGFASVELLGIPVHHSKGFQRPIMIYKKTDPASVEQQVQEPAPPPTAETNRMEIQSSKSPDDSALSPSFCGDLCTSTTGYAANVDLNPSQSGSAFVQCFSPPLMPQVSDNGSEDVPDSNTTEQVEDETEDIVSSSSDQHR